MLMRLRLVLAARRWFCEPKPCALFRATREGVSVGTYAEKRKRCIRASLSPRPKFLRIMMEKTNVAKRRAMAMTALISLSEGSRRKVIISYRIQ